MSSDLPGENDIYQVAYTVSTGKSICEPYDKRNIMHKFATKLKSPKGDHRNSNKKLMYCSWHSEYIGEYLEKSFMNDFSPFAVWLKPRPVSGGKEFCECYDLCYLYGEEERLLDKQRNANLDFLVSNIDSYIDILVDSYENVSPLFSEKNILDQKYKDTEKDLDLLRKTKEDTMFEIKREELNQNLSIQKAKINHLQKEADKKFKIYLSNNYSSFYEDSNGEFIDEDGKKLDLEDLNKKFKTSYMHKLTDAEKDLDEIQKDIRKNDDFEILFNNKFKNSEKTLKESLSNIHDNIDAKVEEIKTKIRDPIFNLITASNLFVFDGKGISLEEPKKHTYSSSVHHGKDMRLIKLRSVKDQLHTIKENLSKKDFLDGKSLKEIFNEVTQEREENRKSRLDLEKMAQEKYSHNKNITKNSSGVRVRKFFNAVTGKMEEVSAQAILPTRSSIKVPEVMQEIEIKPSEEPLPEIEIDFEELERQRGSEDDDENFSKYEMKSIKKDKKNKEGGYYDLEEEFLAKTEVFKSSAKTQGGGRSRAPTSGRAKNN